MPRDQELDLTAYQMLVERIAAADGEAPEELYELLSGGVRFLLARGLSWNEAVEEEVRNVFAIIVRAIRDREVWHAETLIGHARSVIQSRIAERIQQTGSNR